VEWLIEVQFWQYFGKAYGVMQVWFGVAYGGEVLAAFWQGVWRCGGVVWSGLWR